MQKQQEDLGLVWGARAIGEVIGRSERQVFMMLDRKRIWAAKRIGGRWCADLTGLRMQFITPDKERAA